METLRLFILAIEDESEQVAQGYVGVKLSFLVVNLCADYVLDKLSDVPREQLILSSRF